MDENINKPIQGASLYDDAEWPFGDDIGGDEACSLRDGWQGVATG